jgi:cobalt-precorrin 5A hydrolase
MAKLKIAIITINKPSLNSAIKLNSFMQDYDTNIYTSYKTASLIDNLHKDIIVYDKLDDILPPAWEKYDAIICILAIGAVVRKIAPLLKGKDIDPAIIVINLDLNKIVPLLSGHIGGANNLSDELVKLLPNSINFISTATDQTKTLAFEVLAQQNNWDIKNLKELANISNRLLNDQVVNVATYKNIFDTIKNNKNLKLIEFDQIDQNTVVIDPLIQTSALNLRPKISLGIGCNKGVSKQSIQNSFEQFLKKYNLSKKDICKIASFEAKSNEKGLLEFAKQNSLDISFYQKDQINSLEQDFTKSASTKFFGLKGVAEPSAILSSTYAQLIIPKEVYNKEVTIAGVI